MAACYLSLNNFEDALHSCQLAKVGDPKNVKTLYREAQAYAGLGNLVEATASFW
jgi:Flp pilus assembly protein TadD